MSINFLRFFSSNETSRNIQESHGHLPSTSVYERATVSAGPQLRSATAPPKRSKVVIVSLPEVTLTVSLNLLSRAIHQGSFEERESEERASASLLSRSGKARLVRYKVLLEKANGILGHYPKEQRGSEGGWGFMAFCYECGKSSGVILEACQGCHMLVYCGKNCRVESWRKGHKDECKSAKTGISIQTSKTSRGSTMPKTRPSTGT